MSRPFKEELFCATVVESVKVLFLNMGICTVLYFLDLYYYNSYSIL